MITVVAGVNQLILKIGQKVLINRINLSKTNMTNLKVLLHGKLDFRGIETKSKLVSKN